MPYIGQEPVAGNFVLLDAITTSATATYALTKNSVAYSPESSRNMIVSLNGVTQAPEAAYTVSGSNITFSSALTASDVIDYILVLGDVLDIGRPSDGVVGTDQMNYPLGNFSSTGIDDNATSTAITIDSSENVGIGTASPDADLEIRKDNASGLGAVLSLTNSNTSGLTGNSVAIGLSAYAHTTIDSASYRGAIIRGETTAAGNGHSILFETSDTSATPVERVRIDHDGNVGIGTTSTSGVQGLLHIHSSSDDNGDGDGQVNFGDESTVIISTNATSAGSQGYYGSLFFGGQDVSSATQQVWKLAGFSAYSSADLGTTGSADLLFYTTNSASTPSERMRIDASGKLLVGKTSSSVTTAGTEITSSSLLQSVSDTSTNLATNGGAVLNLCNTSATDGNFSNIGGYNSNGLVVSQMNFINLSHSSRTGAITFSTHSGSALNEAMRIDSSGNVGIGTTTPNSAGLGANGQTLQLGARTFIATDSSGDTRLGGLSGSNLTAFYQGGSERMRIDSSGNLLVGTDSATQFNTATETGWNVNNAGSSAQAASSATVAYFNRLTTDGTVVSIRQAGVEEGTISVSGSTVSYNGGHLSRWSQSDTDDISSLYKGTVMSNLDEMCQWDNEDNEQLNKTKVSDVEGDVNVAGVFVAKDNSDDLSDYYLAMTGDMIIRIAQGTTVQRGDLLMSAGDGTAKPQDDDIVRSKTIAKVTSTNVTCTYADGSYCVPCVLMAC